MGNLQEAIERLDSCSKKVTRFLIVSSTAFFSLFLFTVVYQNSEFNVFDMPAKANILSENYVQNSTQQNPSGIPQNVTSTAGSINYTGHMFKDVSSQNTNTSTSGHLLDGLVIPGLGQNATNQSLAGTPQNVTSAVGSGSAPNATKQSLAGISQSVTSTVDSDKNVSSQFTTTSAADKLLDGLLAPGFDQSSCLSRYQSYLYRKNSPHKPSSYLISKLRNYEARQRKCRPHMKSSNKIRRNRAKKSEPVCNYIVWKPANGLGNRMISMASAFLYAVLMDRILLVDFRTEMSGVFCEPFPNASWLLPPDIRQKIDRIHFQDYEVLLNGQTTENSTAFSRPFLFINLQHSPGDQDKIFHCDHIQALLRKAPTLILRSDQYFVPSLFMIPSFQAELNKMFPEKETVFHHLGRYLFHPSNEAWGLITKFYKAHLARADQRVGLQIRVFHTETPHQTTLDQIMSCTIKNKLLPQVDNQNTVSSSSKNRTRISVLVASLYSDYSEKLRIMYKTKPTVTGEIVGVYQPSQEEKQKSNDNTHNMKALADIYLLSLCDVLVTSGRSTFGYVAQSLGGMKPWVLSSRPPFCQPALSMEPCFHFPPKYGCKARTEVNITSVFPNMRSCEDMRNGVKLVNDQQ